MHFLDVISLFTMCVLLVNDDITFSVVKIMILKYRVCTTALEILRKFFDRAISFANSGIRKHNDVLLKFVTHQNAYMCVSVFLCSSTCRRVSH